MKDAFKIKARDAAQSYHIENAIRQIRPTLLKQPVVARTFNLLPPALRTAATVMLAYSGNSVIIYCNIFDLPSFKDAKLLNMLEKFADWQANTTDYTYHMPNRDFTFTRRFTWEHDTRSIAYKKLAKEDVVPQTFEIFVKLSAYVKQDSATCRIITKTHEEVITKEERIIVCD
jgi:hypothetical protein